MFLLKIGSVFELEVTTFPSLFLRLPFLGEIFLAPGGRSCWDSWAEVRREIGRA